MLPHTSRPSTGQNAAERNSGWIRFARQFEKDLAAWTLCVLFLWLFRWVMIFLFRSELGSGRHGGDLLKCVTNGLRFDASVATYWMAVPMLLSVSCVWRDFAWLADRVRLAFGVLFLTLSLAMSAATVAFFQEYHDQFNHWIFGVIYDDRRAILRTVWAEYHVVADLLLLGVAALLGGLLLRRLLARAFIAQATLARLAEKRWPKLASAFLLPIFLLVGLRGSLGPRPLQEKDLAVTADDLLNKLTANSYYALKFALRHQQLLTKANGLKTFLPQGDVGAAARLLFPAGNPRDLDACLEKRARGFAGQHPKHVFLVVMESFDAWPMLPDYESLGLTPRLSQLAKEGLSVKAFVPSADGTMPSLSTMIAGIPHAGVFLNYQPSSRRPFPCAAASIFKRLGYTTRFFYGGYLSWQRVGDFCKDQGFDEVYGGGHVSPWGIGREWGVPDGELFRFVAKTVADDQPSFNMIMSTSYHPPFNMDVYGMGFPLREMPDALTNRWDGKVGLKVLGHLWYADRCLGDFVKAADQKLQAAVFAVTGDHWSRHFLNGKPTLFERTAVPCVFYGPKVLPGVHTPPRLAGAHIDLVPTLVELCAPAGFQYHSFGSDMLNPSRPALGFGLKTVISPDFIFEVDHPERFQPLPGPTQPGPLTPLPLLRQMHQALHGLAWWRAMRGSALPAAAP